MTIEILTPDEKLFSGEGNGVLIPGISGEMGILENHAPLITTLKKGTVKIDAKDGAKTFDVNGGVLEVLNNKVIILAE